jgi:hypothetical protein
MEHNCNVHSMDRERLRVEELVSVVEGSRLKLKVHS